MPQMLTPAAVSQVQYPLTIAPMLFSTLDPSMTRSIGTPSHFASCAVLYGSTSTAGVAGKGTPRSSSSPVVPSMIQKSATSLYVAQDCEQRRPRVRATNEGDE